MEVRYRTRKLAKVCNDDKEARKAYGLRGADKLKERIGALRTAPSIEFLVQARVGRCHLLKGDRAGTYAMDLVGGYRLLFEPHDTYVEVVIINAIEDYH